MCQKKNCYIVTCPCCCQCYCNESCYDCWESLSQYYKIDRCHSTAASIRNKFVCFPCRRVWKSYTSKYIVSEMTNTNFNSSNLTKYVPNICKPGLPKDKTNELARKYCLSRGTIWQHVRFENEEIGKPKCSKCGKEGLTVGRNFRHCKSEKHWNELEESVKNGTIDLQKDFYDYPKEGKCHLSTLPKYQKILQTRRAEYLKREGLIDKSEI